jgi:zinc D-Ala-D-Ala carboxypeptidase
MGTLSDHFDIEEVTVSHIAEAQGIPNILPEELRSVVTNTAAGMERIRALLGNKAIHIDSWYRCPALNTAVGSKSTSDHLKGMAVDFICQEFGSPLQICQHILAYKELIPFKQLILEHTWVHISFDVPPVKPKQEVLSLIEGGKYAIGLTNMEGQPYGIA